METAITSVFSTMRSGSNEVFLRTSFQYSKANLRKKLVSYFTDQELRQYDLKARKKKDLWCKLIKAKKERCLQAFQLKKKQIYYGHNNNNNNHHHNINSLYNNNNNQYPPNHSNGAYIKQQPDDHHYHQQQNDLPPMINNPSGHSSASDTLSCSTSNNSCSNIQTLGNNGNNNNNNNNNNPPPMPPINWGEIQNSNNQYQPYQTLNITPYSHPQTIQLQRIATTNIRDIIPTTNNRMNNIPQQTQIVHGGSGQQVVGGYGSHRDCGDCMIYMNKLSQTMEVNRKLQQENSRLKQAQHQYLSDTQEWKNKYQNLYLQYQSQQQPLQQQQQIVGHGFNVLKMNSNGLNDDETQFMTMPNLGSDDTQNSNSNNNNNCGDNNNNHNNNLNNNNNNNTSYPQNIDNQNVSSWTN